MRIGVLTSGGDAPGMNAAIRAVVRTAAGEGIEVLGIERGYQGLMDRRWRLLTRSTGSSLGPTPEVDLNASLGGSFLGSARCKAFYEAPGRVKGAEALREMDGLVVLGGNGSLGGAHVLVQEHGAKIVGIPASIDHDIGCTSASIGVDSALNTIVNACDRISDTARAHRRAFVIEVMGRQSGYLCMASSVAAGADAALFREQGRSDEEIVRDVAAVIRKSFTESDKQRVLILKAEGVEIPCTKLVRMVQDALPPELLEDISIRATVLGHLVRGGSPSFLDRMIASRFGHAAALALRAGKTDLMTAWQPTSGGEKTPDHAVRLFTLEEVLRETAALLDGSSPVTQARVALMERAAGVLAL